MPASISRYS